jgi:hypothetical protein
MFSHLYMFQEDNLDKANGTKWNVSHHKFHELWFDNNNNAKIIFHKFV